MSDPIITLTTDFGEDSPYVAVMKGVILTINPVARIVDLSHQIPPQDLRHAAFFLAESLPYFPAGVIHVVVVDPDVGSERALLYVELQGVRLLVPDNGCWTMLLGKPVRVIRLTSRQYWRAEISNTFHGRDILAPVAAHLSRGIDPSSLGPVVSEWKILETAEPQRLTGGVAGEVMFVDHFGNLITNIPGEWIRAHPVSIQWGVSRIEPLEWVRSYSGASPGRLVGLQSSSGYVEIAVVQGSAAKLLNAKAGNSITISFAEPDA
jgi:S-adenosylmethionine hydrolase